MKRQLTSEPKVLHKQLLTLQLYSLLNTLGFVSKPSVAIARGHYYGFVFSLDAIVLYFPVLFSS